MPTFEHDPANPTHLSFARYNLWRRSKCPDLPPDEALLNATLGLCGEVGELAETVCGGGEIIVPVIEEAGDAIFYAAWVLDAVGRPPVGPSDAAAPMGPFLDPEGEPVTRDRAMISAVWAAARAADRLKKHRFHGRKLEPFHVAHDARGVLEGVVTVLESCGHTFADALASNVAKLDARYPDGFAPGGGVRIGRGA